MGLADFSGTSSGPPGEARKHATKVVGFLARGWATLIEKECRTLSGLSAERGPTAPLLTEERHERWLRDGRRPPAVVAFYTF